MLQGLFTKLHQNFHHCTLTSDGQIHNYSIAAQVWTCELDNLAEYV
jgi:hypothetical protein